VRVNRSAIFYFPRTPIFTLVSTDTWRDRLRLAIRRSGKKQSAVASDAGVSAESLSRILNARVRPTFDTVVSIARALNESVGWLLDERGFSLSADEQKQLRKVVRFLDDTLLPSSTSRGERRESNAHPAAGVDVPTVYAVRGARLTYEASGDSMIGAGIVDRDLLFVKPTRDTREAAGRVVVCRLDGEVYVKVLDVRGGRIRLLSRNERYSAIEVDAGMPFELLGTVVGRTGPIGG
jgi:SOS-response transcriptional repressor LexA